MRCRYRGPVEMHNFICMLRARQRSVNALHQVSSQPSQLDNVEASSSASTDMINAPPVRAQGTCYMFHMMFELALCYSSC